MMRRKGRGIAGTRYGSFRHRLRYRFDNLLARGTGAALVWLGAVTLAAVVVSSVVLWAFGVSLAGSDSGSLLEDFWQSLMRMLDPGTMSGDVGWGRRILALLVTVFGLLVAGTLIGIIAAGVEQRIERMQRGRSAIIESDHYVVLGASERLPIVLAQLVLANAGRGGAVIVVMADRNPAEMFEDVGRVVDDWLGSRLVFRSGDPTRASDLALVRLDLACAVIVLAEEGREATRTSKTVLAIGAQLGGFEGRPIVVEVGDAATAATLVRACGPDVHPLVASQSVARIAAFALRRPGLSQVISELLDFRGCDLYVQDHPELVGTSFGDMVGSYAKARPLGRMRPDGRIDLNPAPDTRFEEGDRLIAIADDAAALERVQAEPMSRVSIETGPARPEPGADPSEDLSRRRAPAELSDRPGPEHLVVMGWNAFGAQLLGEWALHSDAASTVEVFVDPDLIDPDEVSIPGIDAARVNATPRVDVAGVPWRPDTAPPITTIMLLAYTGRLSGDEADTRTLLDLTVILRERGSHQSGPPPRLVVELLDVDHIPLAEVSGDDYLVSPAIADHLLAQLADSPRRRPVLLQLYGGDGPSLDLVPAERLGLTGETTAAGIFAAAYAAGLLAIGWRRSIRDGGGLILNPHRSEKVALHPGDQVVVIG